jgi:serine/threonine-protein kinase
MDTEELILNNRYALEQKIGEGGMATVYRGRDMRLSRRVAVKILHRHYVSDADFLRRFQHEAQAAATLNHPNVVSVYDVGQDGDNHYIVMEYVDGVNLKTLINRDAPLQVAHAVAIAEEIGRGLETAHQVGLVHRDVKPANVMVTPDGHAVITDFGIAKSHLSTTLTRTGVTFGTADYISPEQAQGKTATPRSDIYSLGVTLYEMLTARLPFTGDSPVAVAMQHVSAEPPPPHQIIPQIPPSLEKLILETMAKDPDHRPTSAHDFVQRLQNYRAAANQQTAMTPGPAHQPAQPAPPHPDPFQDRNIEHQQPRPGTPQPRSPVHHSPPPPQNVNTGGGAPPAYPRSPQQQGGGGSAATPPPRHVAHRSSPQQQGSPTIPPPRSATARAPQQQGIGCGVFVVGMLILVGVMGLILAFSSGIFDGMLAGVDSGDNGESGATFPLERTATPTDEEGPTPTLTTTPMPTVVVPDLVGMTEQEMLRELENLDLTPVIGSPRNSSRIPQGAVIAQDPPEDTELEAGESVVYNLSLGPEVVYITVPDLVGYRFEDAKREAQNLGLTVIQKNEPGRNVTEGFIISQNPASGLRVRSGETLQLVVSLGDVVWMPNLFGKSEEAAKATIESTDGLIYSYSDYQGRDKLWNYDQVAPGVVVSTIPDKDQWVPRGTHVTLGVREY